MLKLLKIMIRKISIHEIMKKEKEISISFAVTPPTAKVIAVAHIKYYD